jgi:hypothetical protein
LGAALLGVYDALRARLSRLYAWFLKALALLALEGDRPAAPDAAGLVWAMVVLTTAMVFLFAFQG